MREHGIRRAIGVATLLAASASMSPEAAAQLPPLSPTAGDQVNTRLTTSWLPNERIAKGWQAIAMGQPVTP